MTEQDKAEHQSILNGVRASESTEDLAGSTARAFEHLIKHIEKLEAQIKKLESQARASL